LSLASEKPIGEGRGQRPLEVAFQDSFCIGKQQGLIGLS